MLADLKVARAMKRRLDLNAITSFWMQADRLGVVLQVLRDRLHTTSPGSTASSTMDHYPAAISHWLRKSHHWITYMCHSVDGNLTQRILLEQAVGTASSYLTSLEAFKAESETRVILSIREGCDYDRQRSVGGHIPLGRFHLSEIGRGEYMRYLALLPCAEDGGNAALPIAAKLADLQRML